MVFVVDLNGVLIHDPTNELVSAISRFSGDGFSDTKDWYQEEMAYPLFSGTMDEDEFWLEVIRKSGSEWGVSEWQEFVVESLRPLPAAHRIEEIASKGEIIAVANSLKSWMEPAIEGAGIDGVFSKIMISSDTGHFKPEDDLFEAILEKASGDSVFLIDSHKDHLARAAHFSIKPIHADFDGDWIDLV